MELHAGENILFEGHPSWRSSLLFFVKGFILAALVGAVVWFAADHTWGVVVGLGLAVVTIIASAVIRWGTDYAITNERLHIRRGILSRTINETRLGRVQNVTVSQGVWERLLRIGTAEFDTASEDQNDFVFAGIANPDQVREAVDHAHRYGERQQGAAAAAPAPASAAGQTPAAGSAGDSDRLTPPPGSSADGPNDGASGL